MKRQVMSALLGSALAMTLLTGCGSKPVLGVLLATSGHASDYGESMQRGVDLAITHLKAEGEFPKGLKIVTGDSGTNPEQAVAELRRMASESKINMLLAGITSDEAKAILPVLEETRVMCLSPSATAPVLTKDSRYFFRVFPSDELEGRRAGRFLYEDKGHKNTVIYTPGTEQARGIEPPFRQMFEQTLLGKVVGRVLISEPGWEEVSTDILTAHRPESAYILGMGEDALKVVRHLKEKGFTGTICATSAFNSGKMIEENKELVDGIYFPQPAFDVNDEREIAQKFVKAYRDTYHMDPDIYAAHAYDATKVVAKALTVTVRLEPGELRKALQFGLGEFPGVTGAIQFDDFGDVHHNPVMFLIKDGQVLNHSRYVDEEKKRIRREIQKLLAGG